MATSAVSSPFANSVNALHTPTIRLCIALFFGWQYAHFPFIDREYFLQMFEDSSATGVESGFAPLVYACCSVGALMSQDVEIREEAAPFAQYSEELLTLDKLNAPSITVVQAFLVLAAYNFGSGRMTRGWVLSGVSFRMGQELGFQRDHSHWEIARKPSNTPSVNFNNEHWRKLYWGSFLVDKILSLFMGRPTFMHDTDADVDISEPPPDDPHIWEDWLLSHDLGFLVEDRTAAPNHTSLLHQQVELGRIIHDILSTTFVPKRNEQSKARRWTNVLLNQLNARLLAWHETLPSDMRWKKWVTAKENLLPDIAMLHALYHNTRICLNLPFLASSLEDGPRPSGATQSHGGPSKPQAAQARYLVESANICRLSSESLVDILHRFRAQHTLANSPIILLYAAIVAANACLVTLRHQHRSTAEPPLRIRDTSLPALDTYLQELSVSWALAGEARIKFQRALTALCRPDMTVPGQQIFGSEQRWDSTSAQPTPAAAATPAGSDTHFMDMYTVDPALQTSVDQGLVSGWYHASQHHSNMRPQIQVSGGATGTCPSPDAGFESPIPFVWDPMSVLDGEAELWAATGGGGSAVFPAEVGVGGFDVGSGGGVPWAEGETQTTGL
ncbi:hypothetical protein KVR01_005956 [Diaporthe batatas]|uniref:uncharacterized protein n=1 Tax=Diaporthe batatas TaxID=748121 RepID=UPI001D04BAE5|nr:uncharacterized protein KVR01_005956 [Diaporthe batatas]KAG8164038.1 hypothetical protein KVR01_005956 [Diaporthe batatas]